MADLKDVIWDRVYELTVGNDEETLTLDGFGDQPAQIQFNVSVAADVASSIAEITVYGLNRDSRRKIYEVYEDVKLVAGWRNNHSTIFQGNIYNVTIGRDGPESYLTMQCRSLGGEWLDASINKAWAAGTPAKTMIEDVAKTFGYPVEFVGDFDSLPSLILGQSKTGSSKRLMNGFSKNYSFSWKISNRKTIITRLGAVREQDAYKYYISRETGMKGTPRIKERGIDVTAAMIPQLSPSDQFIVENITAENTFASPYVSRYRDTIGAGRYVARGIQHVGDYEGQSWDTIVLGWEYRVGELVQRTGQ